MSEPEKEQAGLLDRWWVRLLVAAWLVAVVAIYFRFQIMGVLEMIGLLPHR